MYHKYTRPKDTDLFFFHNLLSIQPSSIISLFPVSTPPFHESFGFPRFLLLGDILLLQLRLSWACYVARMEEGIGYFKILTSKSTGSRPRWSRGYVLASRSKVHGFKSGWGRWIFFSGRDFMLGARVWDFRLVKELQAWKIRLLSNI